MHIVEYRTLIVVWLVLVGLTAVLVAASFVSPALAVLAMLFITPTKAGLVLYIFMHLKYEAPLFKIMVLVALATLVIFIGMTFLDVAFR
ncbi:MAG: cytochrome C oxidase subunit IV family protein [Candidatus Riflebacteria bacterium]|nr:cytochrome C oxidase subunit IV family protein [Candidatus Riflebacteria bacterium]